MAIWRKTFIRKLIDVSSRTVLISRRQRHCRRVLIATIIIAWGLLAIMAGAAQAEDGEDKLGNWMGVNSTVRFSDHWSLFGQGEVRFWEVASDLNELLWRVAGHYDINKIAMVGLGYVRVDTWPFDDGGGRLREENRLYQQFALKQAWARAKFEHRFRLEQRWFPKNDGESDSNRARYRLQVAVPLTHATMQPGAYLLMSSMKPSSTSTAASAISTRTGFMSPAAISSHRPPTSSSAYCGRHARRRTSSACSSITRTTLICVNPDARRGSCGGHWHEA